MARRRHSKPDFTPSAIRAQRRAEREEKHLADLRYLSKRGLRPDPDNYRAVRDKARELRQRDALEKFYSRKVSKADKAKLKERGFHVSRRGVAIDGPRDARRKKIKGAKMRVSKEGAVVWSIGQRRDFVYGFTKKEKVEFARDPELFTKKILARLRKSHKTLGKTRPSKIQIRLQWGAFQATKDFSPHYHTKAYVSSVSPEDKRAKRKTPRLDKLTGLHFVVHVPSVKRRAKTRKKK